VDNLIPSNSDAILDLTTAVYVAKFHRIYIFGGGESISVFPYWKHPDGIWFIDLLPSPHTHPPSPPPHPTLSPSPQKSPVQSPTSPQPPPPAIINCSQVTSEVSYPHPTDTTSFIICHNDTGYEVFICPRTLLFDVKFGTCNAPELVLPELTCFEKRGANPYPDNTTKFIICRPKSVLVDVYDCPKPLHFNPETKACAFRKITSFD
jgi:hypothetical protein